MGAHEGKALLDSDIGDESAPPPACCFVAYA